MYILTYDEILYICANNEIKTVELIPEECSRMYRLSDSPRMWVDCSYRSGCSMILKYKSRA